MVEQAAIVARDATAAETRPEHLLAALLADEQCLATRVLAGLGAAPGDLRAELDRLRMQYVDGLDADDAAALRAIGIDLDEVVRRIDRNLGGPCRHAGSRGSGAGPRRRWSWRCARRSPCGTTTSAPSTCCSGWSAAVTGSSLDTLGAFEIERDALREAVAAAVRQAGEQTG